MYFGLTNQFKKDLKKLKVENNKLPFKVWELILSIEEVKNKTLQGIGQPEQLKANLAGCYSRRINQKHRLIYRYSASDKVELLSVMVIMMTDDFFALKRVLPQASLPIGRFTVHTENFTEIKNIF